MKKTEVERDCGKTTERKVCGVFEKEAFSGPETFANYGFAELEL